MILYDLESMQTEISINQHVFQSACSISIFIIFELKQYPEKKCVSPDHTRSQGKF